MTYAPPLMWRQYAGVSGNAMAKMRSSGNAWWVLEYFFVFSWMLSGCTWRHNSWNSEYLVPGGTQYGECDPRAIALRMFSVAYILHPMSFDVMLGFYWCIRLLYSISNESLKSPPSNGQRKPLNLRVRMNKTVRPSDLCDGDCATSNIRLIGQVSQT